MNVIEENFEEVYLENFWVSSSPLFSSTLIVRSTIHNLESGYNLESGNSNEVENGAVEGTLSEATVAKTKEAEQIKLVNEPTKLRIKLFDADGNLFNELNLNFGSMPVGLIDLEPCMAECKFESGMKHARLKLESSVKISAMLRLHTRDWSVLSPAAKAVDFHSKYLVPLEPGFDKSTWIVAMNDSPMEIDLKLRLSLGRRSPEITVKVAAFGVGVFDTKLIFKEVFDQQQEEAQAFVRVSLLEPKLSESRSSKANSDQSLFIECIDLPTSPKLPRLFSVFC
jgi:hypothetical protein